MSAVVSATTRKTGGVSKFDDFLRKADALLQEAGEYRALGHVDLALEYGYRAALRIAGAWVADSKVARRVRKPSDAWGQLALVGGDAAEWAVTFQGYSQLRSHVVSGVTHGVDSDVVDSFLALVVRFRDVVMGEGMGVAIAA